MARRGYVNCLRTKECPSWGSIPREANSRACALNCYTKPGQKAQQRFRRETGISNRVALGRLLGGSGIFKEPCRELEQAERWEGILSEGTSGSKEQGIGYCKSGSEKARGSVWQELRVN